MKTCKAICIGFSDSWLSSFWAWDQVDVVSCNELVPLLSMQHSKIYEKQQQKKKQQHTGAFHLYTTVN